MMIGNFNSLINLHYDNFQGDKRLNLITALRRTLIGEITFTEAVSNYGICVTTFSPYIMKAREELRKIATHGDGLWLFSFKLFGCFDE